MLKLSVKEERSGGSDCFHLDVIDLLACDHAVYLSWGNLKDEGAKTCAEKGDFSKGAEFVLGRGWNLCLGGKHAD